MLLLPQLLLLMRPTAHSLTSLDGELLHDKGEMYLVPILCCKNWANSVLNFFRSEMRASTKMAALTPFLVQSFSSICPLKVLIMIYRWVFIELKYLLWFQSNCQMKYPTFWRFWHFFGVPQCNIQLLDFLAFLRKQCLKYQGKMMLEVDVFYIFGLNFLWDFGSWSWQETFVAFLEWKLYGKGEGFGVEWLFATLFCCLSLKDTLRGIIATRFCAGAVLIFHLPISFWFE